MASVLSLLNLEAPELQTIVIHLGASRHGDLPSCNRAIHAQVLEWFRLGQPEFSKAIHDSQVSPISLSGLVGQSPSETVTVQEGDEFYFRIGLLHKNLLEPLFKGLERWGSSSLVLAHFPFSLKHISMLSENNPLVRSSDYAQLAHIPTATNSLTLKFLSPTSFKLNQRQHTQPIPLPESVFSNLQRRWNTLAPRELQFPKIQWSGLICDFELNAQRINLDNAIELGAVGWVRYQFPDPQQARMATVLAHFAFFAGVGRKTAMGMGQTLLIS